MNKVNFPDINFDEILSTCLLSVGNRSKNYKEKFIRASNLIKIEWESFENKLSQKRLHLLKYCKLREPNQIIISDITKQEFMDLYSKHMLKEKSEARKIYDLLRASSNGICPLCGISGVRTLDHYLPKSRYPALSVNPKNLVPACENCNTGKSSNIFLSEGDRPLYPYGDDRKFYTTDWIKAEIIKDGFLTFEFFTNPPQEWSLIEKNRVKKHFEEYDLSTKYSLNSAQFVTTIMSDIKKILYNGNFMDVQEHYTNLISVVPVNSTLRIMYKAIVSDRDVCEGHF